MSLTTASALTPKARRLFRHEQNGSNSFLGLVVRLRRSYRSCSGPHSFCSPHPLPRLSSTGFAFEKEQRQWSPFQSRSYAHRAEARNFFIENRSQDATSHMQTV